MIRGDEGVGKTALLDQLVHRAVGCTVARSTGVESESDLAYAGLQQLCSPFLGRIPALPPPQQSALRTALGLEPGKEPDRFLVDLATLTLLTEVSERQPLVCVVDNVQWLDPETVQALGFVARRLSTQPMLMVLSTRDTGSGVDLAGLPELVLEGLSIADSEEILRSVVTGSIDPRIRDRIVAESHGNPSALLELPHGLSAADLSFELGSGVAVTPASRQREQHFALQLRPLPGATRQLLLTASAEPIGDLRLLLRAADHLGLPRDAATAAETAGLIELGDHVRFGHPLVRTAVYRSATPAQRRAVHRALAQVTDLSAEADRRAWHRTRASVGPDEGVALDLEGALARAAVHGGVGAVAVFLERAVAMTVDAARLVPRCLAAARATMRAGNYDGALALLARAEREPLAELERARVELLRAECAFSADHRAAALPKLLAVAHRLESLDPGLSKETFLDALAASLFAGRLATRTTTVDVANAASRVHRAEPEGARDALLNGLVVRFREGYVPAVPPLRDAVHAFSALDPLSDDDREVAWLAAAAAGSLWDDSAWDTISRRHLSASRDAGVLSALPLALSTWAVMTVFTGNLGAAASLAEEARRLADHPGGELVPYGEIAVLAMRGDPEIAEPAIAALAGAVTERGEGVGLTFASWCRALMYNGLGRYQEAQSAASDATGNLLELGSPQWALGELVEAAVHSGDRDTAAAAHATLSKFARASGTRWALGVTASKGALLAEGDGAEALHREGISHLGRTGVRVELARAQLLYGEWLRREGRRTDAREQLRSAHDALSSMGVGAFARRAHRELVAAGEARRHGEATLHLTAQEATVARLAAQGLTSPEIGSALYISSRTVEWHLRNVFAKLGVRTRRELRRSLPSRGRIAT